MKHRRHTSDRTHHWCHFLANVPLKSDLKDNELGGNEGIEVEAMQCDRWDGMVVAIEASGVIIMK